MTAAAIDLLRGLYDAALASAAPMQALPRHLPEPPKGRTVVVGVGKAGASMARAVEAHWPGPLSGVVAVPQGATLPLEHIEQIESSHPVPDERSVEAGRRLMAAVAGLGPEDLVLALISGGGSALCALPAPGVTLGEKQAITRVLLLRGATIHETNAVRKHLSALKGGRLAAHAHPAPVVSLLISDIPGDDPTLIASAPNVARPDDLCRCAATARPLRRRDQHQVAWRLERWLVRIPESGRQPLCRSQPPRDHLCAGWPRSRRERRATARVAGAHPLRCHAGRSAIWHWRMPQWRSMCIHALSAGTDGLDGNGAAAGAWFSPNTLSLARAASVDPVEHLHNNDSFTFFDELKSTVVTGPTFSNINDFRAVLVEPGAG